MKHFSTGLEDSPRCRRCRWLFWIVNRLLLLSSLILRYKQDRKKKNVTYENYRKKKEGCITFAVFKNWM